MANNCSFDMTMCPECVQYVRHCLGQTSVDCPFCEASFSPSEITGTSPSASAVPRGLKKGVMAASFVGATVLGGMACSDDVVVEYGVPVFDVGEPAEDAGTSDAGDAEGDAAGDATDDDDTSDDYESDAPAEPVYGVPMPDAGD